MSHTLSLKHRMRNDEEIRVTSASVGMSRDELERQIGQESYDLFFVDFQHQPANEEKLISFTAAAKELGVGVILRLKHTRHAHLCGNFLDLGPQALLVPQVDSVATAEEAVEAFYYPPVGRRSWGPPEAFGFSEHPGRLEYAEWWKDHGILCLQIETVNGVVNARKLAIPGVDMLMFGANDLNFDLETYADPPFASVEECITHVQKQMAGTGVKVAAGMTPMGTF